MFAIRNRQSPTTSTMIRIIRSPVTIHLHDHPSPRPETAVRQRPWSGDAPPPLAHVALALAVVGVVAGALYAAALLPRGAPAKGIRASASEGPGPG